jgi:hypothetical protein
MFYITTLGCSAKMACVMPMIVSGPDLFDSLPLMPFMVQIKEFVFVYPSIFPKI